MTVHEPATHQMTVEFKLLQVPLRPSTINQSPYHNKSRTKCETIHKTRQSTKSNAKMENVKALFSYSFLSDICCLGIFKFFNSEGFFSVLTSFNSRFGLISGTSHSTNLYRNINFWD